jgi:hypothetical protein
MKTNIIPDTIQWMSTTPSLTEEGCGISSNVEEIPTGSSIIVPQIRSRAPMINWCCLELKTIYDSGCEW